MCKNLAIRRIEDEENKWLKGYESLCVNIGIDIPKFFEVRVLRKSNEQD